MRKTVDRTGLNNAELLAVLYNRARPRGSMAPLYGSEPMNIKQAEQLLADKTQYTNRPYFDYLAGRALKVDVQENPVQVSEYDEINGPGVAASAIEAAIRRKEQVIDSD